MLYSIARSIGDRPDHGKTAQRHAFDQLHHDEVTVVSGVDVVDGDDVRMIQSGRRARFLREAMLSAAVLSRPA